MPGLQLIYVSERGPLPWFRPLSAAMLLTVCTGGILIFLGSEFHTVEIQHRETMWIANIYVYVFPEINPKLINP